MANPRTRPSTDNTAGGNLGFEARLWAAADALHKAMGRFASAESKSGGQFYRPSHMVRVLVEVFARYKSLAYDPCCGSGRMFVQGETVIEHHGSLLLAHT